MFSSGSRSNTTGYMPMSMPRLSLPWLKPFKKGVYFILDADKLPDMKGKVFKIVYREYDRIHCIDVISNSTYAQTLNGNSYKLITIINKKTAKVLYE